MGHGDDDNVVERVSGSRTHDRSAISHGLKEAHKVAVDVVKTGHGSHTGTSFEYASSRQDSLRHELELYMECLLYREPIVHCRGGPRIKRPTRQ